MNWYRGTATRRMVMLLLLAFSAGARAETWHVNPDGKPDAKGTRDSAWDIASALDGSQKAVRPGDTIELAAGTYRRRPKEQFEVKLKGEEGKPIHLKPAKGQRVTIDGGLLVSEPSQHLWVWGLELLVSEPQPEEPVGPGSHPQGFERPWGGLNVRGGRNNKYINLVIHDCRQGVSWWVGDRGSELHGCLIYDNGWPATDRGHGHAVYTQNNEGTKTLSDCVMTGGHSYSLHAYGSDKAYVNNYVVEGNIIYAAGSFLVGGGRPSTGIRILENYLHGSSVRVGYTAPYNEDCEVRDNLIVNGGLSINKYRQVVQTGNVILKEGDPRPAGSKVVLRPNRYDKDRANLAVFKGEEAGRGG